MTSWVDWGASLIHPSHGADISCHWDVSLHFPSNKAEPNGSVHGFTSVGWGIPEIKDCWSSVLLYHPRWNSTFSACAHVSCWETHLCYYLSKQADILLTVFLFSKDFVNMLQSFDRCLFQHVCLITVSLLDMPGLYQSSVLFKKKTINYSRSNVILIIRNGSLPPHYPSFDYLPAFLFFSVSFSCHSPGCLTTRWAIAWNSLTKTL